MALSEKRKQEINRRVELTGKFLIDTRLSTRMIAEHFSLNKDIYFDASHVTISDYIKKYILLHPDKKDLVMNIIKENRGSLLNNEKVLKRINDVYLLLEDGYNFEEISTILNESYWVVYYDIHLRLSEIDKQKYKNAQDYIKTNQKRKNSKQD